MVMHRPSGLPLRESQVPSAEVIRGRGRAARRSLVCGRARCGVMLGAGGGSQRAAGPGRRLSRMAGFTFTPLTPSAYLDRAAWVFRDRAAVVDGERSFTYAEFADRAHRLAGALLGLGVPPGGGVPALCVNSHTMLELHNGVPLAGAVLVPLNIRLSRDELTYIVRHSGARVLVATAELADVATDVAAAAGGQGRHRRRRAGRIRGAAGLGPPGHRPL